MQNRTALKRQMKDDMITMLDANDAIGAKTRFTNFCVGRRIGLGERSMLADLVGLYQDSN